MNDDPNIPLLLDLIKAGHEHETDYSTPAQNTVNSEGDMEIEMSSESELGEETQADPEFLFNHEHALEQVETEFESKFEPKFQPKQFDSADNDYGSLSSLEENGDSTVQLDSAVKEDIQRILNRHMQQAYREIIQLLKDHT